MSARRDLDALTREAKEHWAPGPERGPAANDTGDVPGDVARSAAAEKRLFDQIDAFEAQASREGVAFERSGGRAGLWGSVAVIAAVAAGVMFFGRSEEKRAEGPASASVTAKSSESPADTEATQEAKWTRPTAPGSFVGAAKGAELRANGIVASSGASLHDGERFEARGGSVAFTAPGRADWTLESGTEVVAARAGNLGGAIIFDLNRGAIEAQVVPVPGGEAFAVDVDGVRVAVHGTHLRVARGGDAGPNGGTSVVVDLSEGVILVGAPPKAGTTLGKLVTAPAHVEFSTADVPGTLRVDHEPGSVRTPVDPTLLDRLDVSSAGEGRPPLSGVGAAVPATAGKRAAAAFGADNGGAPLVVPATPSDIITAAVRTCADQTLHGGSGVLTISSMLTVDVKPDGFARVAVFDPPLPIALQTCVAGPIYAVHFAEPGAHRLPIELHR